MFTTATSATTAATNCAKISTSANSIAATHRTSTGRAKEGNQLVPSHCDAANDYAAVNRAGRSQDNSMTMTPPSSLQDNSASTMAATSASTPSPSPSPANRPKTRRKNLASVKAACAGGDRGHQVIRPSPLRSMMTAT